METLEDLGNLAKIASQQIDRNVFPEIFEKLEKKNSMLEELSKDLYELARDKDKFWNRKLYSLEDLQYTIYEIDAKEMKYEKIEQETINFLNKVVLKSYTIYELENKLTPKSCFQYLPEIVHILRRMRRKYEEEELPKITKFLAEIWHEEPSQSPSYHLLLEYMG
jgi:hypothetical protein